MTKFIIIPLILIITCACSRSQKSVYKPDLKGTFVIGSYVMQPKTNADSLKKYGLTDIDRVCFNFLDNDTVVITPKLGMALFGDSIFNYEQTDKFLSLTNGDKKFEIPLINDGIIRLEINNKDLKRLDLTHPL